MTHLAFVWLDVRMDDHVSLERLFLDEALVAQVAPVGSDVGVDQNMALHVGQQCELASTDATLVLLHSLEDVKTLLKNGMGLSPLKDPQSSQWFCCKCVA